MRRARRAPWLWLALGVGAAGAAAWWLARPSENRGRGRGGDFAALAARRAGMLPIFRDVAKQYGVPLPWLLAFAHKETKFRNIRSKPGERDDLLGGAWGPLQVTSDTAGKLGFLPQLDPEARGRAMLSSVRAGISLGALYLLQLVGTLGPDLARVAAGYNAGPNRVLKGKVPTTTRLEYVPLVLGYAQSYESVT